MRGRVSMGRKQGVSTSSAPGRDHLSGAAQNGHMARRYTFRSIAGEVGTRLPITVVVPAYRRPGMLARALHSVRSQTVTPAEVIVVDDASGDETGDQARTLGATVVTHPTNLGEGAARNTGIEAAQNDWVALLDCDDEWLPQHLETLWAARNGHLIVGTAALATGSSPDHHRLYGWPGRRARVLGGPADVAVPENKLVPSTVMLRREVAVRAGGFRSLPRAADLDMWVRMLQFGTAVTVPQVTALYHVHPDQISGDSELMHAAHRDVLNEHAASPWCTRAVTGRHRGVMAWDTARAELKQGRRPQLVIGRLALELTRPQRAIGVGQLLWGRFRARRAASRLAAGGAPAVALMPRTIAAPGAMPASVDLRERTIASALLHLLRRPASQAITSGRLTSLAVRALGVQPVRADQRDGAP